MHSAKILADSISPEGVRLTTLEVTFPRNILAEVNTHRVFSRNSASSRAIPVEKMLLQVMTDPYIPTHWGKNQKGMQAQEVVDGPRATLAANWWLHARDQAVDTAKELLALGIHKQITNRLLEPFLWHTAIISSTEWSNWDHLRDNEQAHPEIQKMARLMKEAREGSTPSPLAYGQWHLPLMSTGEINQCALKTLNLDAKKVSVGRCARVSYLTHEGKRDMAKDVELHDSLLKNGHMSPFEHVARPMQRWEEDLYSTGNDRSAGRIPFCGNFRGWVSYRKEIPNEEDILGAGDERSLGT